MIGFVDRTSNTYHGRTYTTITKYIVAQALEPETSIVSARNEVTINGFFIAQRSVGLRDRRRPAMTSWRLDVCLAVVVAEAIETVSTADVGFDVMGLVAVGVVGARYPACGIMQT